MRFASVALGALLLAGCWLSSPPPPIGNPCETGVPPGETNAATIATPDLRCEGNACIQFGDGPAICSAACSTQDDCTNVAPAAAHLCVSGFRCAVVTTVGTHACQQFCVCADRLEPLTCVR
jgi:hypothetical protein